MRKMGFQLAPNPVILQYCDCSIASIFKLGRARCATRTAPLAPDLSERLAVLRWSQSTQVVAGTLRSQLAFGLGLGLWVVISTIPNFNPGCHRLGNNRFQKTSTLPQVLRCFLKSSRASQTWASMGKHQNHLQGLLHLIVIGHSPQSFWFSGSGVEKDNWHFLPVAK